MDDNKTIETEEVTAEDASMMNFVAFKEKVTNITTELTQFGFPFVLAVMLGNSGGVARAANPLAYISLISEQVYDYTNVSGGIKAASMAGKNDGEAFALAIDNVLSTIKMFVMNKYGVEHANDTTPAEPAAAAE